MQLHACVGVGGDCMVSKRWVALVLGFAVTALGCNDSNATSSGLAMCGTFKACGGDVLGKWKVAALCFDNPEMLTASSIDKPECKGLIRNFGVHTTGTYQFTADGNVSSDITFTMDMEAVWTSACLNAVAGGAVVDLAATCSMIEANYAQNAQFADASCMAQATSCNCMVTSVDHHTAQSGAYAISGTTLTDGDGSSTYCVAGQTLKIHSEGADGGGTVTLTKN